MVAHLTARSPKPLPERHCIRNGAKRLIPIVLSFLFLSAGESFAQVSGHWEQVYSLPHWQAVDMQFSDAQHGILLAYYPHSDAYPDASTILTDDGGKTWNFNLAPGTYFNGYYNFDKDHTFS
ncbi:MAG TPA: hypothetical protein VG537_01535, partial [Candidatus Kapabacteria bacterium]|nr:hypothetical protein [Candidatus Kapabacteria bacterium]